MWILQYMHLDLGAGNHDSGECGCFNKIFCDSVTEICDDHNRYLTPGITRRAHNLETIQAFDESHAIRGRVHAVVMLRLRCGSGVFFFAAESAKR